MTFDEIKVLFVLGCLAVTAVAYGVFRLLAMRRANIVSAQFQKLGLRRANLSRDGLLRRALVSPLFCGGQTYAANWAYRGQGPDWKFVVFEAEYFKEDDGGRTHYASPGYKTAIAFEIPGGKLPQNQFEFQSLTVYARGNMVVCHLKGVRTRTEDLEALLKEGFQAVEAAKSSGGAAA